MVKFHEILLGGMLFGVVGFGILHSKKIFFPKTPEQWKVDKQFSMRQFQGGDTKPVDIYGLANKPVSHQSQAVLHKTMYNPPTPFL